MWKVFRIDSPAQRRGSRHRQRRTRFWRSQSRDRRGFAVAGAILGLLALTGALGITKIMWNLHRSVQTQVQLDRCTAKAVIRMRAAAQTFEASYFRIQGYKMSTLAVCFFSLPLCPAALRIINTALQVERKIQQSVKVYWSLQRKKWDHGLYACQLPFFIQKSRFPEFDFEIIQGNLTDLSSLTGISRSFTKTKEYSVTLHHHQLHSKASLTHEKDWTVQWTR